ncbi:MAG: radical SAM protein [Nitrospinae bacterium]|nr:radical SAM protein [Nitrospinota bacterium]
MKVFLGNAPWAKKGFKGVRAGSRWPHFEHCASPYMPFPFFLSYAAALLKKNGVEVLLVDAIAEGMDEEAYFTKIASFMPDLVMHEVSTASIVTDLRQGKKVKELLPAAKLAFCGAHDAMFDPAFLDQHPFLDFSIEGEYEFTVLELAQNLAGPKEGILGLVYRGADGAPRKNGRRPLAKLDDLPWPAREFLPMMNYWDNPGGIPSPSLQVHASRGCPFTCAFCSWPQVMYGGNKYRARDPKDVVREIVHCRDTYGFKSFYFDDDTFNIGKKRILALCDEMIRENLGLPWAAMARADTADAEMLAKMKEAGLVSIKYGVESGEQKILDDCGKRLDLAVARETVRETKRLGIKCHLTFTFGLPGETKETIRKTMALAEELDPDTVQFSIATPYPGSRLYRQLSEKGHIVSADFSEYDGGNRAVIRTDALEPRDLEEALRVATTLWHRKRFVSRVWANRGHFMKEFAKHPIASLRAVGGIFLPSPSRGAK